MTSDTRVTMHKGAAALIAINQPFTIWLLRNFFADGQVCELGGELGDRLAIDIPEHGYQWSYEKKNAIQSDWKLVHAEGARASDPLAPPRDSYERGLTDEFVEPVVLRGRPRLRLGPDAAIFFNFRPDRARQLAIKLLELFDVALPWARPSMPPSRCVSAFNGHADVISHEHDPDILASLIHRRGWRFSRA